MGGGAALNMPIIFNLRKCFLLSRLKQWIQIFKVHRFKSQFFKMQSCCSFSNWRKLLFRLLFVWSLFWTTNNKIRWVCTTWPLKWKLILYLSIIWVLTLLSTKHNSKTINSFPFMVCFFTSLSQCNLGIRLAESAGGSKLLVTEKLWRCSVSVKN